MEDLHYLPKLSEIRKLIYQWKSRKSTPIGQITVIMSLKNFESDFLQFLWDGKVHRVKKSIIVQDYCHGGLNMIDYGDFITALKSTWIKRLIRADTK